MQKKTEPVNFNDYRSTYIDEVEKSMSFSNASLQHCTQIKTDCLLEVTKKHANAPSELSFLDVGCGIGLTDTLLYPHVKKLTGIDIAHETVEVARQNNPGAHYNTYEGNHLPYSDDTFDISFAICVFHHVPPCQWIHLLGEMKRVTKSTGFIAIMEHNPLNPLTRLAVHRCPFDANATLLTRRNAINIFKKNDMKVLESRYILFTTFKHRFFRALDRRLGRLCFGAQHYIIGRKKH